KGTGLMPYDRPRGRNGHFFAKTPVIALAATLVMTLPAVGWAQSDQSPNPIAEPSSIAPTAAEPLAPPIATPPTSTKTVSPGIIVEEEVGPTPVSEFAPEDVQESRSKVYDQGL